MMLSLDQKGRDSCWAWGYQWPGRIAKTGPEVNNQGADNRGWTKPLGIVHLLFSLNLPTIIYIFDQFEIAE